METWVHWHKRHNFSKRKQSSSSFLSSFWFRVRHAFCCSIQKCYSGRVEEACSSSQNSLPSISSKKSNQSPNILFLLPTNNEIRKSPTPSSLAAQSSVTMNELGIQQNVINTDTTNHYETNEQVMMILTQLGMRREMEERVMEKEMKWYCWTASKTSHLKKCLNMIWPKLMLMPTMK